MKIAISITTHNRYEVFKESYLNIKKYLPKGATLVVVDDGSNTPVPEASFRFETSQGIAVAKNKCLELMGEADYYFCFDDDVYPKCNGWHLPYINSGVNHLCFTFDKFSNGRSNGRVKISENNGLVNWHEPCGLMLFFTRKCLDAVGGLDPAYGKWGYEHVGWSMRIHNAGLTPHPFIDVSNSLGLFYSFDWDQTSPRSVNDSDRAKCITPNRTKYHLEKSSSHYIPFKKLNSCVITTYFTGVIDPQRNTHYEADAYNIKPLSDSCFGHDAKLVVLNDCFPDFKSFMTEYINANCSFNPYFARWFAICDYLTAHPEIEQVFCTDATDVEMQINPFMQLQKGFLYIGDEPEKINNIWLKKHHTHSIHDKLFKELGNWQLLNMGIVGGYRDEVLLFCKHMIEFYETVKDTDLTDMAAGQHIGYFIFGRDKIKHGQKINTRFKANERNTTSFFKHK
jgi:glycosyltransferase involved in cell wall biosynthesis